MAKIAFIARQVGTANAFAPVIRALEHTGLLLAFPAAAATWRTQGLQVIEIEDFDAGCPLLAQNSELRLLVTGTSFEGSDDARFWAWGKAQGLTSLAFVDHWTNYARRFQAGWPDWVVAIDQQMADGVVAVGGKPEQIIITGHPGFDRWFELTPAKQNPIATVLFVSEPHSQVQIVPFTEFEALRWTLDSLSAWCESHQRHVRLWVKPHPIEHPENLQRILDQHPSSGFLSCHIYHGDREEAVLTADAVVGMTSLLLVESSITGKPVVSVLPQPLPAEIASLPGIATVDSADGLGLFLNNVLTGDRPSPPPPLVPLATRRLVALIQTKLDQVDQLPIGPTP